MATIKLSPKARDHRAARDPKRSPVRAATAPRVHSGQGPKKGSLLPAATPRRAAPAQATEPVTTTGRVHRLDAGDPTATSGQAPNASEDRLSKRMASLGLASRREADAWIQAGWVRVDGAVATLGQKVAEHAVISLDPQARGEQAKRITILLHKPLDVVSGQAEDGHVPASTLVLKSTRWPGDSSGMAFDRHWVAGLAPAGRLDVDSTGLLVLTQDGRIARQLIGEHSTVDKEYIVRVDWRDPWAWSEQALDRLRHGLALDGEALKPAQVERLDQHDATSGTLRLVLTEGKKRQIRRMAELVGLRVLSLQRVRIGRVQLGDLPLGAWRLLGADESFI